MEMHQLRYFTALAASGKFGTAAERCNVSQPSLSQQIRKLEDELGETLLERRPRGAALTPAGEILARHARRILDEAESAVRAIRDLGERVRGPLAVGALPTIAPYLLPERLREFSALFPEVALTMHEETTANLLASLHGGDLDIAIVSPPVPERGLKSELLFSEELLLAMPASHALAREACVAMGACASLPFILMQEGHCLGAQALDFCTLGNFQPSVSCRSTQIETIKSLIASGMGVSLIPAMAVDAGLPPDVVARPVNSPHPTRGIMAVWRENPEPGRPQREFLELLRRR